jgi:hypothetical protein
VAQESHYIDEDTTDEFMDLPVPRYAEPTKAELKNPPPPLPALKLPPLTEH